MTDSLFLQLPENRPSVSEDQAKTFLSAEYGISADLTPLPSERDQNFRVTTTGGEPYILKITSSAEDLGQLEAENEAMALLAVPSTGVEVPMPVASIAGNFVTEILVGKDRFPTRLLSYVEGSVMSDVSITPNLRHSLGRMLGSIDIALSTHRHHATQRDFYWDLRHGAEVATRYLAEVPGARHRSLVEFFLDGYATHVLPALPMLRRGVIHHDANDHNVIVRDDEEGQRAIGIIDFGDMVYSCVIFELAVGCAYAILSSDDPITDAASVVSGYNDVFPLDELELDVLYYLIAMRLCMSVTIAAHQTLEEPGNDYLATTQSQGWQTLERLRKCSPSTARKTFRSAAGITDEGQTASELVDDRAQRLGLSLRISYDKPLKIVRGAAQYLYDDSGRAYLDAVNNVPHVGHCHPRVVAAAQRQMALLNTNTRYLHDSIVRYVKRLTDTLPDPLNVCFLVNSGSEANDLALRLARAHTGSRDVIVVDGAYHGNLSTLIDISPYKFDGAGGSGTPPHVHKVTMPDPYRGTHRGYSTETGRAYAEEVSNVLEGHSDKVGPVAAFVVESLLGCGGQIVLPDGYLTAAFKHVRAAGGVCIADEVQVGFGRVGTHFWGFETQGVVPDIVTLGKPIGNGHPLAAVITTPEIAASFDTGMEYFNTFGGNPVSCEIGLAVLEVVQEEGLQENARVVGEYLMAGLRDLMTAHQLIGDVRGAGLFVGVELVRDHDTLEPAAQEASLVVEGMKDSGVLMSTDGPLRNVLKIKPPMVFNRSNAARLVETLDRVLREVVS